MVGFPAHKHECFDKVGVAHQRSCTSAISISCGAAPARAELGCPTHRCLLFYVYCVFGAVVGLNPNNELIKVNTVCKQTPVQRVHHAHTTDAASRQKQRVPSHKSSNLIFAIAVLPGTLVGTIVHPTVPYSLFLQAATCYVSQSNTVLLAEHVPADGRTEI
jgi:hypothetical protein